LNAQRRFERTAPFERAVLSERRRFERAHLYGWSARIVYD
jgi:hypothetical protein